MSCVVTARCAPLPLQGEGFGVGVRAAHTTDDPTRLAALGDPPLVKGEVWHRRCRQTYCHAGFGTIGARTPSCFGAMP